MVTDIVCWDCCCDCNPSTLMIFPIRIDTSVNLRGRILKYDAFRSLKVALIFGNRVYPVVMQPSLKVALIFGNLVYPVVMQPKYQLRWFPVYKALKLKQYRSGSDEARTRSPSVLSQAIYH